MRCYAVLAPVSRGYPPLEGRLVTCYSPGRHFTHGLLHFLVRLACVRHAASVDSEPGSNSRLKPVICSERTNRPSARRLTALFCEYVQTFSPNISIQRPAGTEAPARRLHHNWHVQPFVKDRIAFPPERCAFSPYRPTTGANPYVLETYQSYRDRQSLSTR